MRSHDVIRDHTEVTRGHMRSQKVTHGYKEVTAGRSQEVTTDNTRQKRSGKVTRVARGCMGARGITGLQGAAPRHMGPHGVTGSCNVFGEVLHPRLHRVRKVARVQIS